VTDPKSLPTLEQFCRALAAHALVVAHPEKLHEFLAPELAESTASFIHRFAIGERINRKPPQSDGD
jgi:hypothetical protein